MSEQFGAQKNQVFTCDCGFSWKWGTDGSHYCSDYYREEIARLRAQLNVANEALEIAQGDNPNAFNVAGDLLPPIGSVVEIHLASIDKWVKHKVVGYYAWPDLGGDKSLHRVFVKVADLNGGHFNARLLKDIKEAE